MVCDLWLVGEGSRLRVYGRFAVCDLGLCCTSGCLLSAGFGYLCVFDLKTRKLKARSDALEADFTDLVRAKVTRQPSTPNNTRPITTSQLQTRCPNF